jgi:hypothetical protein
MAKIRLILLPSDSLLSIPLRTKNKIVGLTRSYPVLVGLDLFWAYPRPSDQSPNAKSQSRNDAEAWGQQALLASPLQCYYRKLCILGKIFSALRLLRFLL